MRRAIHICLLLFICSPAVHGKNGQRNIRWIEIRTPHFRVLTDGSAELGSVVGTQLECSRELLFDKSVAARNKPDAPLFVIAFRSGSEMRQVAPLWKGESVRLGGLFLDGDSGRFIGIDLSAQKLNHVVAHEFSHSLVSATGESLPLWLQEGLAEVFAAATENSERAEADSRTSQISMTQLLSLREDSPEYNETTFHAAFYTQASLVAEYLWADKEQKTRLLKYLELTRAGIPVDTAIQQAFQVSSEELNKAVKAFASQRQRRRSTTGVCSIETSEIVPIPEIDAQARVAEFQSQTADHRDDAIHKFKTILRESPRHEIALRGLAYGLWRRGDVKQASEFFRLAAEANSADGKLQYLSAVLNTDGAHDQPERRRMQAALLKSISLDPEFADAHHWLSLTYAWDGDYDAACKEGLKALELDPKNEEFKFNLAAFYAHAQRWSEARALCQELSTATDKDVASQASLLFKQIEHTTP